MFDPVDPKQRLPELEEGILRYWSEEDTFKRSLKQRSTGTGDLLAGTIKDVIPRYQTMRGKYVERRFGWDCHGLPVENIIEQEKGIKSHKEIEEMGIAAFNGLCRTAVQRYAKEWRTVVERMGRWVDMDWDYRTMDPEYMESIWWVFSELAKKDLIYEGHKPMHICPRCVTPLSNFEVTQGYKDITDTSVTVKFELADEPGTFILAWTTTPWTLPGNLLLAVDPHIKYVKYQYGCERYILAKKIFDQRKDPKNLLHPLLYAKAKREGEEIEENPESVEDISIKTLLGKRYIPLFPYFQNQKEYANAYRIVGADFVTADEGTGIVHIAPGFGGDGLCGHGSEAHRRSGQDRPSGDQVAQGTRQALRRKTLHAQLPALLALRLPSPELRYDLMVRFGGEDQRRRTRRECGNGVGARAHPRRTVRQVAGRGTRLGDQSQPLLGHAFADLALPGDEGHDRDRQQRGAHGAEEIALHQSHGAAPRRERRQSGPCLSGQGARNEPDGQRKRAGTQGSRLPEHRRSHCDLLLPARPHAADCRGNRQEDGGSRDRGSAPVRGVLRGLRGKNRRLLGPDLREGAARPQAFDGNAREHLSLSGHGEMERCCTAHACVHGGCSAAPPRRPYRPRHACRPHPEYPPLLQQRRSREAEPPALPLLRHSLHVLLGSRGGKGAGPAQAHRGRDHVECGFQENRHASHRRPPRADGLQQTGSGERRQHRYPPQRDGTRTGACTREEIKEAEVRRDHLIGSQARRGDCGNSLRRTQGAAHSPVERIARTRYGRLDGKAREGLHHAAPPQHHGKPRSPPGHAPRWGKPAGIPAAARNRAGEDPRGIPRQARARRLSFGSAQGPAGDRGQSFLRRSGRHRSEECRDDRPRPPRSHAPHPRGARLLVRERLDALRTIALPVRLRTGRPGPKIPAGLSGGLHRRRHRPDTRMVLHAHDSLFRALQETGVLQLHRQRHRAGGGRQEDEQAAQELPGNDQGRQSSRRGCRALHIHELARRARRGSALL